MKFQTLAILLALSIGCSKIPSDMPKVYPCKITVLHEGKPVAEAGVQLADEKEVKALWCDGKTDSAGVATIRTVYGKHSVPGVPEGTFKVAIIQSIVLETEDPTIDTSRTGDPKVIEYMKKREDELKRKQVVPALLNDLEKTPISVRVEPDKSNALTVDVSDYAQKQ